MNKERMKRILKYIKPFWAYAAISVLCALISAVAGLVIPILCGGAIDCMIGVGKVDFSKVTQYMFRIGAVTVCSALAQQALSQSNNKITYGMSKKIRNEVMEKLHRLPLSYMDSHPTGDLLSRMVTDVETFSEGMLMGFSQLFTGVVTIVGTLAVMLYYNVFITAMVFVLTPMSLFAASFISKKTHHYFASQARVRGEETALINEIVDGQREIYAYSHEEQTILDFDKTNEKLSKVAFNATFFSSLINPGTRLINNLVYACVSLASAFFALYGGITVGRISVFLSYAGQYAKPFNEISSVLTELQNAAASIARVFELLDEKEEKTDKSTDVVLEKGSEVKLSDVTFGYVPGKILLDGISLNVKSGQRVAIVGPTGCGKTTLINLLMRFYHVNGGEISVNGINIENITQKSLRQNYGMVLQDTWLRSGTIKENIAYGRPDATDEEIIEAAKKAFADSFIRRLPKGYDTVINENGEGISAGQRQLLCIARVMLSRPNMLILDEATSSIDTRTEIKIQAAFSKMMEGRTSFIVAHRLSTIREADIILVMKEGNIIEQGKHEELLKQNGFYANLYNSQFAIE